jgi:hypothetical protein
MEWLAQNWVFALLVAAVILLHLFGHGGHGAHGGHSASRRRGDDAGRANDLAPRGPGADGAEDRHEHGGS